MRNNIKYADDILNLYFPVLDGGFISLKDYMGSDETIVQCARNSYSKGTKKISNDRGLIRRLIRDKHTSPLEFAELTFHVRAPLYVIQQWLRHRTNNFCSESHRFSEIKDDFQTTNSNAWRLQNQDNKQGSDGYLSEENGKDLTKIEEELHNHIREVYNKRIENGVAREQARKDVPHSTYLSIYIKSDLHNLLHFLKLRTAQDAQLEIRDYAHLMACMVKRVAPLSFEAFLDYAYAAKSFSRLDLELLNYINGFNFFQIGDDTTIDTWESTYINTKCDYHEKIGMTKRELVEFFTKLTPPLIPNFDLDLSKSKTVEQMEKE